MTTLSERAQAALAARHEREAAALRANLRRRKAKPRPPDGTADRVPATPEQEPPGRNE